MSYAAAFQGFPPSNYVADSYGRALRMPSVDAYYGGIYGAEDQVAAPETTQGAGPDAAGQGAGAGPGAQGSPGGGGGGGASGAGAMMQAIGPIIDGVVGAVSTGVETELKPSKMAKSNSNKFATNLAQLKRVVAEARRIAKTIKKKQKKLAGYQAASDKLQKKAGDWLRDSSNRKAWKSSNRVVRPDGKVSAPGTIWCEELWEGKGREKNPGGTVKGLITTWCPAHVSAYKDPIKAQLLKDQIAFARTQGGLMPGVNAQALATQGEINVLKARLEAVQYTRPPLAGAGGNIVAIRARTLKNWGMLMGIRAYAPLLALAPPGSDELDMLRWAPDETTLVGTETLNLLFPGDEDVKCGRIPFLESSKYLTLYLDLYNDPRTRYFDESRGRWTSMVAEKRPPLWALGLTAAEQRTVGVAVPVWLVELLAQQGMQVTQAQVQRAAENAAAQAAFEVSGYAAVAGPAWGGSASPLGWDLPSTDATADTWTPATVPRDSGPQLQAQSSTQSSGPRTTGAGMTFKSTGSGTPAGFVRADGKVWTGSGWTEVFRAEDVVPLAPGEVDCSGLGAPTGSFLWNLRNALLGLGAPTLAEWEKMSPADTVPPYYDDNQDREGPKSKGPLLVGLGIVGLGAALLWPA